MTVPTTKKKIITAEVKAGIFIAGGLFLLMAGILMLGGGDKLFNKHHNVKARFDDVTGLSEGSHVRSGGISVGRVTSIDYDEGFQKIVVTMLVKDTFKQRIRKDSLVQMNTQGVLGDKYLEIVGGTNEVAAAENNDVLDTKGAEGLTQMLKGGENVVKLLEQNLVNLKKITDSFATDKKAERFFTSLTESTQNLNEALEALNKGKGLKELNTALRNFRIMTDKINNGEGTIGALLNDSSLYEDVKLLIGGASRNTVLKFFVKQAVKSSDNDAARADEAKKKGAKKDPASTSMP